jgi:hypothetical protein
MLSPATKLLSGDDKNAILMPTSLSTRKTAKPDAFKETKTMRYLDFELEIGLGRGREYPVAVVN